MDKWFVLSIILVIIASMSAVFVRFEARLKNEKSNDDLSADDFEILE
jgi:hypothetical protein